jgi:hypothetical protein
VDGPYPLHRAYPGLLEPGERGLNDPGGAGRNAANAYAHPTNRHSADVMMTKGLTAWHREETELPRSGFGSNEMPGYWNTRPSCFSQPATC